MQLSLASLAGFPIHFPVSKFFWVKVYARAMPHQASARNSIQNSDCITSSLIYTQIEGWTGIRLHEELLWRAGQQLPARVFFSPAASPTQSTAAPPGPREEAAQRAAAVPLVPKRNRGDSSDGSGLYQEGGKRGERCWSPWETEKLPEGGGF